MAAEATAAMGGPMYCEEYKELQSELETVRGQWIYFRLTADNRAAGITETHSREMIRRAKDRVDEMKNRVLLHLANCVICTEGLFAPEKKKSPAA